MAEDAETLDFGDNVDLPTFEQILEMDEGEDDNSHEFSHSIVFGFFEQAATTFQSMDEALEHKDLHTLSTLGHYLKGSSATIGFTKIKNECEKIQHFGERKDETGLKEEPDENKLLQSISQSIDVAKEETSECDRLMRKYYEQLGIETP